MCCVRIYLFLLLPVSSGLFSAVEEGSGDSGQAHSGDFLLEMLDLLVRLECDWDQLGSLLGVEDFRRSRSPSFGIRSLRTGTRRNRLEPSSPG